MKTYKLILPILQTDNFISLELIKNFTVSKEISIEVIELALYLIILRHTKAFLGAAFWFHTRNK